MNDLLTQKIRLRKILTAKRDVIKKKSHNDFNIQVFENLKDYIKFDEINFIASFISIRSEISTTKLNEQIIKMKKILSFPRIEKNRRELVFKKFDLNDDLKLGKFDIPEPKDTSEDIVPQLFFVPCLGFDLNGYRIGYGGGFYDKTFAKLKKAKYRFYTVGYAFDEQKHPNIPIEDFDYKLDYVLTEKQLYTFS